MGKLVNQGVTLGEYEVQRDDWRKAEEPDTWHEKHVGDLRLRAWEDDWCWEIYTIAMVRCGATGAAASFAEATITAERVAAAMVGEVPPPAPDWITVDPEGRWLERVENGAMVVGHWPDRSRADGLFDIYGVLEVSGNNLDPCNGIEVDENAVGMPAKVYPVPRATEDGK